MCGIFGFVGDPDRARAIDLEAALRSLKHRGPDDRGTFRSWEPDPGHSRESGNRSRGPTLATPAFAGVTDGGGNVSCAFAHTRLSIIDVSAAGHQPMTTPDGRYTIVYNGEVYNFRELREELGGPATVIPAQACPGHRAGAGIALGGPPRATPAFAGVTESSSTTHTSPLTPHASRLWRSSSDTEVILRAWERWGTDCVDRFRGMFAFAIWDRDERSLFLARDRLGIKPLYYVSHARSLAFASEVRTLLATGMAERRLDQSALYSYLAFGSVQGPATIIEGVREFPPGHSAIFRDGRLSVRRYWSLPAGAGSSGSNEQLRDLLELRHALRDAVRLRLISDVPLGVFLSGGIDSTAIVALAAAASDTPIHTFTVTFDEESYNEETFAAEVASRFGCDHHQVHLSASRAAMEIEGAIRALDQPSADGVNTYFVAKAAREAGLTVALSGLGGDELFAGYRNFRTFGAILKAGSAARFLPFRSDAGGAHAFNGASHRSRKLRALLAAGGDSAMTYAVLRGMFLRDERACLLSPDLASTEVDDASILSGVDVGVPIQNSKFKIHNSIDAVNLFSRLEISNYLRNTLLRDTDAMSMAHSLEVRVPFLDHFLAESVLAMPGKAKIAGRRNKPLLTGAVPEIPQHIVRRRKMGFTLPMDSWLRGPLRKWTEDRLFGGGLDGVFRRETVEAIWKSFLGRRGVSWSRVWCLAALSEWITANGITMNAVEHSASMPAQGSRPSSRTVRPARPREERVLVLAPDARSLPGGIATYTRLMIRALTEIGSERNFKVDALALHDPADSGEARGFGGSRLRFTVAILLYAARHRPALIVVTHLNFGTVDRLLRLVSPGSRHWYVLHGIEAWRRVTKLRRRALSRADLLLAVSRHTRRQFSRANDISEDRIAILPCAIEGDLQRAGDQRAPSGGSFPTLMTVARLVGGERFKGVGAVLRVLPRLIESFPGIRYVVVGDGDDRPRLERLAGDLGVADRVDFRGRIDEPALEDAYSKCTLFVMPSPTEGFGIVYLEAAAFGRPSVAARGSGAEEFIVDGETGILVDPGDDDVLVDTLRRYLAAPREIEALGRRARARQRERFSYIAFRSLLAELLAREAKDESGGPAKKMDTAVVSSIGGRQS